MGKINSFFKKHFVWLFYLYALASAVSITACTVILSLFLLFYVLNARENLPKAPKDFRIFLGIYFWKMGTLLFNGLFSQLGRIINIWDKLPFVFASNLKISERNVRTFLKILFWANVAVIILALLQKYCGFPELVKPLFTPGMDRFKGYFSHPLRFAGYLSSVSVIAFSFSIFHSKRNWPAFLVLFTAVFMTGSRSYFLGVVAACSFLAFFRSRKFFLIFSAALAVYLGLMFVFMPSFSGRVRAVFSEGAGIGLRANFWKAGWEIALAHPLAGVGDKEISAYLKPYKEAGLIDNTAHAHNAYLTAAAENGFLGAFLLVLLFAYFLRKYFLAGRGAKDDFTRAFAFSIFGCWANLAAAGMFESNFSTFIIWSFLTFYMGMYESYRSSAVRVTYGT